MEMITSMSKYLNPQRIGPGVFYSPEKLEQNLDTIPQYNELRKQWNKRFVFSCIAGALYTKDLYFNVSGRIVNKALRW
jgi:hypothetical protein